MHSQCGVTRDDVRAPKGRGLEVVPSPHVLNVCSIYGHRTSLALLGGPPGTFHNHLWACVFYQAVTSGEVPMTFFWL